METEIVCGVREHSLDSWRDFGPYMEEAYPSSQTAIYRGQADSTWKIESALDRLEARFPNKRNRSGSIPASFPCPPVPRDVHLAAFKEAVRGRRGASPSDLSENEWWALAQHHGLATPLLDWTYSPFVALFFAFEEAVWINWSTGSLCTPGNRVVLIALCHLVTDNGTPESQAPTVFTVRREITNRLSSQSGVLMKMPPRSDLESSVRARFRDESTAVVPHARPILTKIVIPNQGREDCLKHLNKMNINRMSLFPDLDGAARYINNLWELEFDTPLGWLPDGQA